MPRYKKIYESHAHEYDALVSREDHSGNIMRALQTILPLVESTVAEFGAGTGRLSFLLAPLVKTVSAFDAYTPMLEVARARQQKLGFKNVSFATSENKSIPLPNDTFDLSIAGWSLGHATSWFPDSWQTEISLCVKEMQRVVRLGGSVVILETLGTGKAEPEPPNKNLAAYYSLLENEFGFTKTSIRTDYKFDSLKEAEDLTTQFFGKSFQFREGGDGFFLPECTGIWYSRKN